MQNSPPYQMTMRTFLILILLMETAATLAAPADFKFAFPGWKRRAFTMAYDDGTIHDRRMVSILNQYGIKGTFYISAARAGSSPQFLPLEQLEEIYRGHEIGSHGYRHLSMTSLSPAEAEEELTNDLAALEKITHAPIRSFAYPYGTCNEATNALLKKHGICCARTMGDTRIYANAWQDFVAWHPTCHHDNDILPLLKRFLQKDIFGGCLGIFTCWGHSYEFEKKGNWQHLEKICQMVSEQKENLWLASNAEIFEYLTACQQVQSTLDGSVILNPTCIPIYYYDGMEKKILPPQKTAVLPMPETPCPEGTHLLFPGGRPKALTFSYDDGSYTDPALVRIFNRYKVKGTFNVNSKRVTDFSVYQGHEVASHSYNHTYYSLLPQVLSLQDIYADKTNIEAHTRTPVRGYAYPNGDPPCYSEPQLTALKAMGFAYARGTRPNSPPFALPENWFNWPGSTRNVHPDFLDVADKFLATEQIPALLYVWGHSTEFQNNWNIITDFLDKLANRSEIWYATNIEIHDYVEAARHLYWAQDKSFVYNPTVIPVYYALQGRYVVFTPGMTQLEQSPSCTR